MGKITVSEFLTLDGVMENPGWSFQFDSKQKDDYKYAELFAHDVLLLGRVTYVGFSQAWPTMEGTGDYGVRMNTMPKYVVTTTMQTADWGDTTIIRENIAKELAQIKKRSPHKMLVFGSGQLVETLIEHDLVDEYRLMVFPVVVGSGKRMFTDKLSKKVLRLADNQTFPSGVVTLTYVPERKEE